MKRASTWAGVIGGILVASFGYALADIIVKPTGLFWVNVAMVVTNLLWLVLGTFLVLLFVKLRHKEDIENGQPKPSADSPEDIERLKRRTNWILAFVLVVEFIGSTETWFLNDYMAGLTVINLAVIFDLLIHIIFFYVVIELFRGKKDVLQILLYTSVVYAGGWMLISILRDHWFSALIAIVLGTYFVYTIKAQPNRRSFRVAHLVVLPAFVILMSTAPFFDNGNIPELMEKEILAEQQFVNETANLSSAYMLFLQREAPGKREIEDIRNAIAKREIKIAEIFSLVEQLQDEYKKQLPRVAQKKTIEHLRYFLLIMSTHRTQAEKLEEMMMYAESVDFNVLTDEQIAQIRKLKNEIEDLNTKITEIQFEQSNARLN